MAWYNKPGMVFFLTSALFFIAMVVSDIAEYPWASKISFAIGMLCLGLFWKNTLKAGPPSGLGETEQAVDKSNSCGEQANAADRPLE